MHVGWCLDFSDDGNILRRSIPVSLNVKHPCFMQLTRTAGRHVEVAAMTNYLLRVLLVEFSQIFFGVVPDLQCTNFYSIGLSF